MIKNHTFSRRYGKKDIIKNKNGEKNMKNLFEELWYGNIAPIDNIGSTPEIDGKREELSQRYNKLTKILNKEQIKQLNEYDECGIELSSLYESKIFEHAFKLGANFAIEILKK